MRKCLLPFVCVLSAVALLASLASTVGTSYWTQSNEADFKAGTLENVVATNLGDLKLSRAVKTLLDENPQVSSVNTLAEGPDGTIYAGTGPHALLLQIKDEKVTTAATIADAAAILSLLVDKQGRIIMGTGGEHGRILRIGKPGDKPEVLFEADGVQYVWALAQSADGMIYAATGPAGQLFEIKPDGSKKALLESGESNLLSLVYDGKDLLYVGTDPHGLVYRVNRKTGESFVLYNAAESEISALALDKKGNLYAGTSEAKEEAPAAAPAAGGADNAGRPEGNPSGVPIPADRPKEPTPPPPPNPNPGQPDPIPKAPGIQTRAHEQALIQRRAVALSRAARLRIGDAAKHEDRQSLESALADASWRTSESRTSLNSTLPAIAAEYTTGFDLTGLVNADPTTLHFALCTLHFPPFAFAADAPADSPDDPPKSKHRPKPGPHPGKPDPAPSPTSQPAGLSNVHPPTVDTTAGTEPRAEGNAIYKIDPDGFVTEIFRQPVLILSMVENNGTLIVATGGTEGQVYQVRPSADETLVLAKVDPRQIMCLLPTHDGKILMGTANVGSLASMTGGFAAKGTYTSQVLDATQISRFGKIHLHGVLPAGTGLTVATRTGNVMEADDKTWSKWSDEAPAAEFMQVMSPSARFLQYRLTFTSPGEKGTPIVRDVSVAYQVPNLPPQIKNVKIANSTSAAAADSLADPDAAPRRVESSRRQTITWDASDPNNDALMYSLYLRPIGEPGWILLKDRLTDTSYEWDTRTTADGRYEVKVVASDAASNPPGKGKTASRVSDPITVDNTPPVIGDVKTEQHGGDIQITLKVVDRTSTVAAVDYSVDSGKDWQFVLPTDQIYDSPEETVVFSIPGLKPGQHQISLRATDSKGNLSFENVFVTVQSPAASVR